MRRPSDAARACAGLGLPAFAAAAAAAAGACALTTLVLVPGAGGAFGAGLAVLMIAVAAVDARAFIIPDELTAAALALGAVYAAVQGGDLQSWPHALGVAALRGAAPALAFLALRAGYRAWRGLEGIGLGDVKLAAVAGVWLDWPLIAVAVDIAALAALAAFLAMHVAGGRAVRRRTRLPFGLFLAPAIWLAFLADTAPSARQALLPF